MASISKPEDGYRSHRALLEAIARESMRAHGLDPDFPPEAVAAVAAISSPPRATEEPVRDLRTLLWCSIDNDDSRDLDQLSFAESLGHGEARVRVAIADVDATVARGSAVDRHAAMNATSVYTAAAIFPMLPERLSTDITSLAANEDRLAIVVEFVVSADGALGSSDVHGALVRNHAKLAYDGVNAWLNGRGPLPAAAAAVGGMVDQLRIQDGVAKLLGAERHKHGALDLDRVEVRPEFDGDALLQLRSEQSNRATRLIEDLMIAANGVIARFLGARNIPSIRRVVKAPERWDRLVALAARTGDVLPATPDSKALADYLLKRRSAAPSAFAELSHTVMRLIGPGQYLVERAGGTAPGHFGLAVKDYTHSTAPNRRYADLLTQRLVKAALAGDAVPYAEDELERLARHCTLQEDAANRVERQVSKSATALLVSGRVGETFEAVVSGASEKGTWVRISTPAIEGKLLKSGEDLDVGDHLRVRLTSVDVRQGFIDFERL